MIVRRARQPMEAHADESRARNQDQRHRGECIDRVDDMQYLAQIHRRHDRQRADRSDDMEGQIALPTPWRPQ
jgi:hypothetical protein